MPSKVSLRISGRDLSEEELNSAIGANASRFISRKQLPSSRDSNNRCIWILDAPDNLDMEAQIQWILQNTIDQESVWKNINLSSSVDVFCGFFLLSTSDGFEIHSETMKELGRRGIKVGFDIYEDEKAKRIYRKLIYLAIAALILTLFCGGTAAMIWFFKNSEYRSMLEKTIKHQNSDLEIYEAIHVWNNLTLTQFKISTNELQKDIHLPSASNPNTFIQTRMLFFENDTLRRAGPMIHD